MRLIELFKTATFRLAVLFGLAVTLSTSIVFLFVYLQVASSDARRVDVRLAEEMVRAVGESDADLRHALDLRLTRDLRRIDYAALFDAQGKLVYGNVASLPKGLPVDGATHSVEAMPINPSDQETAPGLFVAGRRPDGSIVLLGRSLYEVNALRRLVVQALLIGIVPAVVLALITGLIFASRGTRRLKAINQTILCIVHGDLHERLPMRGNRDDIDYVAGAVNLMLDEIVRLLDQIKSVGDNIAHDLRTPLAIARMKLERALEKNEYDALRRTAQHTLSDLDRAMATVTALLRISEIESGRRRSHFKPVDLTEVCANVFDLYEPMAEAKSITMSLEAAVPLRIQGDFDLLIEAVANLTDNAIKFTPAGGEVKIIADTVEGEPVIRVEDRGPGISPEDRDNIFKRFYRGEKTRHLPGHGFGLSMAATIAELHGLSLRVKDNCPGAIFEICKDKSNELSPSDPTAKSRHMALGPRASRWPDVPVARVSLQGARIQ